jgi:hypothetical protein
MGNQMFRYMMAKVLQLNVPDTLITGYRLPEWNLESPSETPTSNRCIRIGSTKPRDGDLCHIGPAHVFPWNDILHILKTEDDIEVALHFIHCRLEYYRDHRSALSAAFVPKTRKMGFGDDYLVINIRLEDILDKHIHPNYPPVPISWYEYLLETTGLKPVFVGQIGKDLISQSLKAKFKDALFLAHDTAIEDFETIRNSKNVVLAVSTFSWLAGWLSDTATSIFLPVYGFYDRNTRSDMNLIPEDDSRYSLYSFPKTIWKASPDQIDQVINSKGNFIKISPGP